jgi:predicted dehydrogenase
MVKKGTLGRIQRIEMICAMYRTQPYYDSGEWRGTWAGEGGGVLLNQGPHPIDAMLYVLCMDPVKLFAVNSTVEHKIETEDRSDVMMWFRNGASGYFHVSTNEWPQEDRLEVTGTKGKLIMEHGRLVHIRNKIPTDKSIRAKGEAWGKPPSPVEKDVTPRKAGPPYAHYPIVKDFVKAVATRGKPAVTGEEGRRSVEIMNAAILSSHTGKAVEIPVNRRKYDTLMKKLVAGSKFKPGAKKRSRRK